MEERRCSRGFLLSDQKTKVRFIESGPYFNLLYSLVRAVRDDPPSILSMTAGRNISLDLMSRELRVYIGVREGKYFITSRQASIDQAGDPSLYPLSFRVSHNIVMGYLRLLRSLESALPRDIEACSSHANKIKCYAYLGASECVFNYVPRCPLRLLLSEKREVGGGALAILRKGLEYASEPHCAISNKERMIDCYITSWISSVLYRIAWKAALDTARIMGIRLEGDYQPPVNFQIADAYLNVKLKKPLEHVKKTVDNILDLDDPYQSRTRTIILLETLPNMLKIISDYITHDRVYRFCRRANIDTRPIRGLIDYYYPFLRGKISESISERIVKLLSQDGCIEPREIADEISEELAYRILETLSDKNILTRVQYEQRHVFIAGRSLEQSTH